MLDPKVIRELQYYLNKAITYDDYNFFYTDILYFVQHLGRGFPWDAHVPPRSTDKLDREFAKINEVLNGLGRYKTIDCLTIDEWLKCIKESLENGRTK